jgi:RNA polymerase sigma factor (TIGR02999 family)
MKAMAVQPDGTPIEQLMANLREGNREAIGELVNLLWPELRRLAAAKMRSERTDHTWQPTALVNEVYLELVSAKSLGAGGPHPSDKNAFMALAGHLMMRLLIHHARPLNRRVQRISIDEEALDLSARKTGLDEVEDLLADLARVDPQLRTVVEMKVFEGLQVEEIATRLGLSLRTVERRWTLAKHWLAKELQ